MAEAPLSSFKARARKGEEVVLPGRFFPCVTVTDEESSQCLRLTDSHDFLRRQEGLVINHSFWGHPAEFVTKVRHVIKFAASENNSRGEVDNFLESVQVFFLVLGMVLDTWYSVPGTWCGSYLVLGTIYLVLGVVLGAFQDNSTTAEHPHIFKNSETLCIG